jgi:hypothetical protein
MIRFLCGEQYAPSKTQHIIQRTLRYSFETNEQNSTMLKQTDETSLQNDEGHLSKALAVSARKQSNLNKPMQLKRKANAVLAWNP